MLYSKTTQAVRAIRLLRSRETARYFELRATLSGPTPYDRGSLALQDMPVSITLFSSCSSSCTSPVGFVTELGFRRSNSRSYRMASISTSLAELPGYDL